VKRRPQSGLYFRRFDGVVDAFVRGCKYLQVLASTHEPVEEFPMSDQAESAGGEKPFDLARMCRYSTGLSPQPTIAVEGTAHIVRYLNNAFSLLVGKEARELIGRPFAEAVPEGDENGCLSLLDRVYSTGTPEFLVEQEHGQTPPVFWSYSVWAILGTDERPVGVMIQVTDSTETAIFRRQSVDINQQLLLSATRQHELIEAADNANRIKDEFLATLSHELRTPLSAIVGWADMLASSTLDAVTSSRAIEVIQRNAQVQVQLIDDLLDVSRIITGKLRLHMQPVDLGATLIAAVDSLRPAAEAKAMGVQLQLDSSSAGVSGDPDRLQQIAWNLISNAIKFTPEGGHVLVRLSRVESHAEVTISDTGKGIAPEFLPHVFDRFRQADSTSTRAFGGLGLGLAIVRQLVELHGGTVRVDSKGEGHGSAFILSLPLMTKRATENIESAMPPEFKQAEIACPSELEGLRVLVVDDESDTCELLQFVLEGCGAKVKTAGSAAAALEAIAGETFDVLLSDIGMPDEDGYSLLAKVRALSQERGDKVLPAAALTAYTSQKDRIRVFLSGFQIHVPKPVSPNEILAVVANLAARESPNTPQSRP
jgi:signal transduction histidine kinase/CheY-like chemotaxis protein